MSSWAQLGSAAFTKVQKRLHLFKKRSDGASSNMIVELMYWGDTCKYIFIYSLIGNTQTGYKPSEAVSSQKAAPKDHNQ